MKISFPQFPTFSFSHSHIFIFSHCICLACLLVLSGCRRPAVDRVEWTVMDTVAAVQFRGSPADADKDVVRLVRDAFDRIVGEFNAFDPQSAINRLGRCTEFGRPCWDFAFRLKEQTGGAFDPDWRKTGKLDFGAVAKGFAVDVAADAVLSNAPPGLCDLLIDLGGNLKAVKGDWKIGVMDGEAFVLHEGEACATSARYFRGDHIKDARSGEAAGGTVHSVTAIHPSSAMVADGLSTVMFILGHEKGEDFCRTRFPETRLIWLP